MTTKYHESDSNAWPCFPVALAVLDVIRRSVCAPPDEVECIFFSQEGAAAKHVTISFSDVTNEELIGLEMRCVHASDWLVCKRSSNGTDFQTGFQFGCL